MALITNNISGSSRGTPHSDAAVLAITGAMVFSKHGSVDQSALDAEVYFFVDGTPSDDLTKSLFNGDVDIKGATAVDGNITAGAKLFLSGAPGSDLEAATKKYVDDLVSDAGDAAADLIIDESWNGNETDKALSVRASLEVVASASAEAESYADGLIVNNTEGDETDKAASVAAMKSYVDDAGTDFLTVSGSEADNVFGSAFDLSAEDTIKLKGTEDQIRLYIDNGEIRVALTEDVVIDQHLTVEGDLTVNGTTTAINTQNLTVEDPMVILANGAVSQNTNGGFAITSGSTDSDLVLGRVANDTWGVGKMETNGGLINSLTAMNLVSMRAANFQIGAAGDELTLASGDVKLSAESDMILNVQDEGVLQLKHDDVDFLKFDMENNAILPAVDSALDLGSLDYRFANVYTGDLHLRNERGNWTLIEEEEFISFRDNNTGKRYKMLMEDITGTGTYGPGNDGEL
jgi:hypothetical protein